MPENIQHCNVNDCTEPRADRRSVCEFHGIRCQSCNGHAVRGRYTIRGRYNVDLNVCVTCHEGAPQCSNCDNSMAAAYMYSVGYDNSCGDCYDNATRYCSDCDVRVWASESVTHTCRPRSSLRSWDYRPMEFIRHGLTTGPTFGVELEVGVRGYNAGTMEELGETLIWAKRDGSVESSDGHEGSELVSHPMTLDWFQGEGMRRWNNILGFVSENGGVNRTCGMHVHVGGENIGRDNGHLATLMYLWNTNSEAIHLFCRRIANRYAQTTRPEEITYFVDRPDRQDRYALVNLTNLRSGGTGTVEFRGFAATTDPQTFQASVEIVAASVEFTREFANQAAGADWDAFGAWIFTHGETYPALASEWLVREVYNAYRAVPVGLHGLTYDLTPNPAPYGYTRTGRPRQAPSEARRRAARARYRDERGRLAPAPEGWTPPVEPEPLPEWERELLVGSGNEGARISTANSIRQSLDILTNMALDSTSVRLATRPTERVSASSRRTFQEMGLTDLEIDRLAAPAAPETPYVNPNGFTADRMDSWASQYNGPSCECSGCRQYRARHGIAYDGTVVQAPAGRDLGPGLTAAGGWVSAPAPDTGYYIGTLGSPTDPFNIEWDDEPLEGNDEF